MTGNISKKEKKRLLILLEELNSVVSQMYMVSYTSLLLWQKKEIESWISFLKTHDDKEAIHSLEIEIGDRFFYRYNVRMQPVSLDNKRLDLYQDIIIKLNEALK